MNTQDRQYMVRAIELARQGIYNTSPNPRVGCVLVKDGRIIGEGFHQKAGEGHAEINALSVADTFVNGATAYVTLEPCSHDGKTPPCANALIEAGVARVVYGMRDPNPVVCGRGNKRMEEAGIQVDGPLLESECQALNPGFIKRMQTGLPRVIAKVASSLDGGTAMQSGESQWITGEHARTDVQKLRAASCAIITGVGTVIQDDPALTVRDQSLALPRYSLRQPKRVIVDSHLRIPMNAKILQQPEQCLVVYAEDNPATLKALNDAGVETMKLANKAGKVDLPALLLALGKQQMNEVMIESGAKLLGAFIEDQLLDEIYLYMAATFLGSDARPTAELPWQQMQQQLRMHVNELRQVGDDYRWHLLPQYASSSESN